MGQFRDLSGSRYGRLTVVQLISRARYSLWLCRCDCGAEVKARAMDLNSGNTGSCGCLKIDRARQSNTIHGQNAKGRRTAEYRSWAHAKERCYNPNDAKFAWYGGRGIGMCPEWRMNFQAFFDHIGPKPSRSHLLDRIDNDGDYEPGNVRWVTAKESARNRRRQRTHLGRPLPWFAASL